MKIKLVIFFVIAVFSLNAQLCKYTQLTDGGESIYAYGMDTTYHWWAVTQPFIDKYRLVVDGNGSDVYDSFSYPVFSPNSRNWAAFAEYNGRYDLLFNDSIIYLNAVEPGEIAFASLTDDFIYSYKMNNKEQLYFKGKIVDTYQRSGKLFLSQYGNKYAFVADRGAGKVVNINGNETTLFDDIIPCGFWNDGRFMYAAKNGWGWEIYLNNERQTQTFDMVYEYQINKFGTNAAFIVSNSTGMFAVMISKDFYDPLIGNKYDMCTGLTLHPEYPLMAYKAKFNTNYMVVFNNTEYPGKEEVGNPKFTHNGEELYFIHCNIDCSLNINGKNIPMKLNFPPNGDYAIKPNTSTIAYCSSTSLIVRNYEFDDYSVSYMLDEISIPRYNRFDDRYEAIGRINERLYLVTCPD